MRNIYTDIVSSPEFHAAAYQMAQASFTYEAIEDTIINEQDFREYTDAEIERAKDAIRTVIKRNF